MSTGRLSYVAASFSALTLTACASDDDPLIITQLSGGETTTLNRSAGAFETAASNLMGSDRTRHLVGDAAFEAIFQPPPATVNAGLGAQFNHVSCASCHVRNGRGGAVADWSAEGSQLLVRISVPGQDTVTGGPLGWGECGDQLQDHAIHGVTPEAKVLLRWRSVPGTYPDGDPYVLRAPDFEVTLGNGEALPEDLLLSPRIPPPVLGLGLLEALSDDEILALADPDDVDGDGISGRPNYVWDVAQEQTRLGRFGWKANTPTLRQQAAAAYAADMGVSNPLFPETDMTSDVGADTLDATAFYTQTLAVPARAALDAASTRGSTLFVQTGCARCHRLTAVTAQVSLTALSNQVIAPYSDLLLHDMGPELADHRPDFQASGNEWRTPPLWGIGLSTKVLGTGAFLHDGRARTLEEAILWHGGEAGASRDAFTRLSRSDRRALLAFLDAL